MKTNAPSVNHTLIQEGLALFQKSVQIRRTSRGLLDSIEAEITLAAKGYFFLTFGQTIDGKVAKRGPIVTRTTRETLHVYIPALPTEKADADGAGNRVLTFTLKDNGEITSDADGTWRTLETPADAVAAMTEAFRAQPHLYQSPIRTLEPRPRQADPLSA